MAAFLPYGNGTFVAAALRRFITESGNGKSFLPFPGAGLC